MAAEENKAEKEFLRLCQNGDLEGVKAALLAGMDVNVVDFGQTGLHMALKYNHNDVVQHLLNTENLNVNLKGPLAWGFWGALHAAVAGHNHEGLAMLLDCPDIQVNATDKYHRTPLWRAVENGSLQCIEMLLRDERVDPNIEGYQGVEYTESSTLIQPLIMRDKKLTPLVYAVKRGFFVVPLLTLLLSNPRTDPNAKDYSNWKKTALMYAVKENKDVEIINILLADPRVDLDTTERFERKADDIAR